MCLTILLLDVPIIRRIKDDKWYKYLLLMPPLLFIALIAAKAYDFVIPVGEYTWNVDLAFALVIVEAINLFYVKFVSKKEVHLSEWFILLAIIVLDFFIKIVWGIFTQNGFNYYNRPYVENYSQVLFYISNLFALYTTIFLLLIKDWGKGIWAAKAILTLFGYLVTFALVVIQTSVNILVTGQELDITIISISVVMSLLVVLMVIFLVYEINKWYLKEKEKQKSVMEQMEGYYDKQLLLNQEELIKLKHDANNFLEIIRLKDEETYQELKDKVQKFNAVYFCKDDILNKILVLKVSEGKEKGIQFNTHIDLKNKIPLSNLDKISLFTNILDNAIEGAINSYHKLINFDIYYADNKLKISIVNSCDTLKSKPDKVYHGKGKEILNDIIKKHNGDSNVYYANQMYSLEINLNFQK